MSQQSAEQSPSSKVPGDRKQALADQDISEAKAKAQDIPEKKAGEEDPAIAASKQAYPISEADFYCVFCLEADPGDDRAFALNAAGQLVHEGEHTFTLDAKQGVYRDSYRKKVQPGDQDLLLTIPWFSSAGMIAAAERGEIPAELIRSEMQQEQVIENPVALVKVIEKNAECTHAQLLKEEKPEAKAPQHIMYFCPIKNTDKELLAFYFDREANQFIGHRVAVTILKDLLEEDPRITLARGIDKTHKKFAALISEGGHRRYKYELVRIGDASAWGGQAPADHRLVPIGEPMAGICGILSKEQGQREKWSKLSAAVREGKLEQVKLLVKEGVDVNRKSSEGETVLTQAIDLGHITVARYLIEETKAIVHPNHLKKAVVDGSVELVRSLTTAGGITAELIDLMQAIDRGHVGVVRYFIKEAKPRLSANAIYERGDDELGQTPLSRALQANQAKAAVYLLEQEVDLDQDDPRLLHWAIQEDSQKALQYLHQKNLKDEAGNTALLLAIQKGSRASINTLLRMTSVKDINLANAAGETALMLAARNGDVDLLNQIGQKGADLTRRNGAKATAFQIALREKQGKAALFLLKKQPKRINSPDENSKKTPLVEAAEYGCLEVVSYLFMAVNPALSNVEQQIEAALKLAEKNGHIGVTDFLRSKQKAEVKGNPVADAKAAEKLAIEKDFQVCMDILQTLQERLRTRIEGPKVAIPQAVEMQQQREKQLKAFGRALRKAQDALAKLQSHISFKQFKEGKSKLVSYEKFLGEKSDEVYNIKSEMFRDFFERISNFSSAFMSRFTAIAKLSNESHKQQADQYDQMVKAKSCMDRLAPESSDSDYPRWNNANKKAEEQLSRIAKELERLKLKAVPAGEKQKKKKRKNKAKQEQKNPVQPESQATDLSDEQLRAAAESDDEDGLKEVEALNKLIQFVHGNPIAEPRSERAPTDNKSDVENSLNACLSKLRELSKNLEAGLQECKLTTGSPGEQEQQKSLEDQFADFEQTLTRAWTDFETEQNRPGQLGAIVYEKMCTYQPQLDNFNKKAREWREKLIENRKALNGIFFNDMSNLIQDNPAYFDAQLFTKQNYQTCCILYDQFLANMDAIVIPPKKGGLDPFREQNQRFLAFKRRLETLRQKMQALKPSDSQISAQLPDKPSFPTVVPEDKAKAASQAPAEAEAVTQDDFILAINTLSSAHKLVLAHKFPRGKVFTGAPDEREKQQEVEKSLSTFEAALEFAEGWQNELINQAKARNENLEENRQLRQNALKLEIFKEALEEHRRDIRASKEKINNAQKADAKNGPAAASRLASSAPGMAALVAGQRAQVHAQIPRDGKAAGASNRAAAKPASASSSNVPGIGS